VGDLTWYDVLGNVLDAWEMYERFLQDRAADRMLRADAGIKTLEEWVAKRAAVMWEPGEVERIDLEAVAQGLRLGAAEWAVESALEEPWEWFTFGEPWPGVLYASVLGWLQVGSNEESKGFQVGSLEPAFGIARAATALADAWKAMERA
jgi:hypothetical protein